MKKKLSAKAIEALQPRDRQYEIFDTVSDQLIITIYSSGKKVFGWRGYVHGKPRRKTLGPYPRHSLDAARDWADEISEQRDRGLNPFEIEAQRLVDEEALRIENSKTVSWLWGLYQEHDTAGNRWKTEKARLWKKDVKPAIGDKLCKEVTADDLYDILFEKAKTAPVAANSIQSLLSAMFKWSVSGKGRFLTGLKGNPAATVKRVTPPRKRTRYLSNYEIRLFFKALSISKSPFAEPLIVLLYTGCRRLEVFEAPLSEMIDLDDKQQWIILGERVKNKLDHVIPLPIEVAELLKLVRNRAKPQQSLMWPSIKVASENPMTGITKAVDSINEKMCELARVDGRSVERWTMHDLRRTMATGMNDLCSEDGECLIEAHIVERCLNHKIPGVAGTYNRASYRSQKKRAFRIWADHLATLGSPLAGDKAK